MPDAPTLLPPDDDRPASGADGGGVAGGVPPDETQGAPPPGPDETPEKRLTRRVTARRVAVAATALLLVVAVGLGALAYYLQTQGGRARVRAIAVVQIANLFADDATVSVRDVDGNFLTGARLVGFEVRRGGDLVLAVDTVRVRYTLRTLVRRTFSASDLVVVGPRLFVRQREDGTFNTAGLLKPAADTTSKFSVLIDRLVVTDGRAEVHWYNPDRDSTLVIDGLQAQVRDFISRPDSLVGTIDGLRLAAFAPLGASRMNVAGAGRFSRSQVVLTRLAARSSNGTRVRGSGRVGFGRAARAGDALPVFDASIEATPFALADARAFAGVALYGDPRLRLTADSDGGTLTLNLRGALDEAAVSLDGELTRATDGPVRYRAEGQLRRFNPAALTRNPALAADLTGDLRVNLEGSSLRALDGPFRVALRESQAAGRRIDRLVLDGAFEAGRITFDLDGALPGLTLVAEGEARPFERVPTFALRGRAQDVNLAVLAPGQGLSGRLAGDVAVEGRGNSLETFFGTAAVALGRTDVTVGGRRYLLDRADVDADIEGGFVAFDADLTLGAGGGRLVATGTVDPREAPIPYTIDQGRVERFNVAALTGDPAQTSSLTGTFALDGSGTDVRTAALDASVQLRGSTFGTYTIAAADVDARLRGGSLAFDASADLGAAGALTAAGTAQPFATPLAYTARGTVRRLDLAALTGNPAQASSLTGAYEASGRGTAPATLTLDARIQLAESSYGTRLVDRTDVRVSVLAGAVTLTGTVDTPDGGLALNLSTRPFDASPTLVFGEGTCFRNVDAGRLTDNPDLTTDLTGCATGRATGYADLATAAVDAVVTLRPSTVNGTRIRSALADVTLVRGALAGTLDATLDAAPGPPVNDADFRAEDGGQLTAAFQGRPFDATPSYAVRGTTRGLDAAALAGIGGAAAADGAPQRTSLSLDFDVRGRGTNPRTLALDGRLSARPSSVGPARIDTLETVFALADGVLRVDTLSFRSDVVVADGSGTVALFDPGAASAFRLAGEVRSLDAFRDSAGQAVALDRGVFDLTATGVPGQPLAIAGTLDADRLAYGTTTVDDIAGTLTATVDRAALDSLGIDALTGGAVQGSATADFTRVTVGARRIESGRATVQLQGRALAVDAFVVVDQRRDAEVAAVIDFPTEAAEGQPARPLTVRLDRARAAVDSVTWTLVRPTTIVVDDGFVVDSLLIRSDAPGLLGGGGQQIAAGGRVRFDGEQDFTLDVQGVDLTTLADLAGLGGLGGTLSASARLTGTAAAPLLDGRVDVADLQSSEGPVGSIAAAVTYGDGRVGIDGAVTHVSGQQLTVQGYLPRRFSLAGGVQAEEARDTDEVRLVARADSFPIAWAKPFLNRRAYSDLGGALRLDLTVTGTEAAPRLAGTASLTDGRLGLVPTRMTYAPITADVRFADNRIELDRVLVGQPAGGGTEAEGGDGLDVTGAITLQRLSLGELDLTITPREFTAIDTRTYRALILAAGPEPLRLTGTLVRPVLRGSVVLSRGDIFVTDELVPPDLEPVELTAAQIRTVEERFGRTLSARDTTVSRFVKSLDYDLQVRIDRNVWIRSDAGLPFDIEFSGNVQATKRPFAKGSQLFGQITLARGTLQTLNRRFVIDRGALTFNGPALSAIVDLQASLDIKLTQTLAGQSAATVLLGVNGQLNDNPEIRLSSDPALDPADIVSLIATGQLAGESGASSLGSTGAGLLLGSASGLLEGFASESLGLDLAEVEIEADGSLVVKVGKYLTNRLFLTAGYVPSRGTSSARSESQIPIQVTLDYELLRWLQAQTEYSGQRGLGGGANAEIAF